VESHSEHLLRRLQRRVAEEELNPEKAALYFCATEGSTSVLNPLRLDLFGAIDNWPQDFFGDEFGEIAATAAAGLRRRASVGS
jgi:predicted ATPase